MRYIVFDTQQDAQAIVDLIDERGRTIYASAGYTIAPNGDVIGKCDGVDNPQGITQTWDNPRQRLDGKWIISHPENSKMAEYITFAGVPVKEYVMDGISYYAEDFSPSWFYDDGQP